MNGTIIFFPWTRSEAGEEELFFFFYSPPRSPSIRRRLPSKRRRKRTPTCPAFHVLRDSGGAANSGRPTTSAPPDFAYKNRGGGVKRKTTEREGKPREKERLTKRKREKKKGKEREGRTQKRERNRGEEKRRKRCLCHPPIPGSTAVHRSSWKLRRVR